jgi:hypothetical protein
METAWFNLSRVCSSKEGFHCMIWQGGGNRSRPPFDFCFCEGIAADMLNIRARGEPGFFCRGNSMKIRQAIKENRGWF